MRASRRTDGGALVLGANYRALGVARSLARRGGEVWVALADEHRVACTSRYVRRSVRWPASASEQVPFLLELAERQRLQGWVLFPTDDETVALLARNADALSRSYRVAAPPWNATAAAYDKRLTYRCAAELGLPQPWTAFPRDHGDVAALDCDFPVVLKPAFKAESNRFTAAKAWRVDDRRALLAGYDEACSLIAPELLMVQELIPGQGRAQLSYAALCRDGEILASASAQRLRQQPMDFGRASSYVETIEHGDAAEHARRLLRALRFSGIVEVEFKRDSRDGLPKLLDINARAWGWHTLCARAGVDFPALYWDLLHGREVRPATAMPGVRWVRMSTDLPTAAGEMRAGRLRPTEYLRSLRGPLEFAIFAGDDPLPALVDLPLLAGLAVRRAVRGDRTMPAAVPIAQAALP
jgi:predicted ATP-grasp superfamily ATP-dependent carboligase